MKKPAFGYKCQECHKGIVKPVVLKDYLVRKGKVVYTIPFAIVGICEDCGGRHYSGREVKRWLALVPQRVRPRKIREVTIYPFTFEFEDRAYVAEVHVKKGVPFDISFRNDLL